MKRVRTSFLLTLITLFLTAMPFCAEEEQASSSSDGSYHLEQVVVLSRHNIRAPLSNSGSAVGQLTPYTWTEWTAPDSELTLKGGVAETIMGQYFRKWLEAEQLIPENYIPEDGEVRFYANARQRTIATTQYFSSGMLPVANVPIEYKDEIGATDPTFKVLLTYMSNAYAEAVDEQLHEQFSSVTIGKNVKKIGKNAFNGCKKLKKITIKTTKLTKKSVGANAFKGISKKAVVKCPKSKKKAYKKFLLKKGLKKTMTFK